MGVDADETGGHSPHSSAGFLEQPKLEDLKCCKLWWDIVILHLRITNFGMDTLQHYYTSVYSSLLHRCYMTESSRENF